MDLDRLKLSIHLVTWNGEKYLPSFFQSFKNFQFQIPNSPASGRDPAQGGGKFFILDNASTDTTADIIEKELTDFSVPHEFFQSEKNLGFAGGHNRLFAISDRRYALDGPDFVLLLNQDLYLEPGCISKLLQTLEEHPELAAVAPRLMRWTSDFSNQTSVTNQQSEVRSPKSDIVDSLGLKIFRNRRVVDQYMGRPMSEVHSLKSDLLPVFGVSGTCPLFRLSALRQVAFPDGSIFDESYGSYKEDVDLAWRLQSGGLMAAVVPGAVAYHARGSGQVLGADDWSAHRNKQEQAPMIRELSYRNHLFTLIKNEAWSDLLLDWSAILWYEWKKFVYYLLFDRAVLRAWGEVWNNRSALLAKRRWIIEKRKKGAKEFREWFV